jgi:hypothetical protein
MRRIWQFGMLLMVLLVAGTPLMACMLPNGVMTAEEKACCREMADQCSQNQMPSSHSCCKSVSPPKQLAVAQSTLHFTHHLALVCILPSMARLASLPQGIASVSVAFGHSPPEAPSSANILRI